MIIDQLPNGAPFSASDEVAIEKGQTTYKGTLAQVLDALSTIGLKRTIHATLSCESVSTGAGTRNAWPLGDNLPPFGENLTLTVRNASTGAVHVIWYYSNDNTFEVAANIAGSAPAVGDVVFVTYQV